jgi:hypothetical protein
MLAPHCISSVGATIPRMNRDWWGIGASTLAQWVGGLGTIAAVIVALFKDSLRSWWNKPALTATCTKQIPWTVRVPLNVFVQGPGQAVGHGTLQIGWSGNCYFVRIRIENTGRTRAEKVQVSALGLARRGLDGAFVDIPTILPLNMKWSNSPPPSAVTVLDGISRGMSTFCDVISLCDPANPYQPRPPGADPTRTIGQLQLEFEPSDGSHLLTPGTYRLRLRIAAANVEPIDRIVAFTHTGTWVQDDVEMRRDHLVVALT